jgi:hypothetical protein
LGQVVHPEEFGLVKNFCVGGSEVRSGSSDDGGDNDGGDDYGGDDGGGGNGCDIGICDCQTLSQDSGRFLLNRPGCSCVGGGDGGEVLGSDMKLLLTKMNLFNHHHYHHYHQCYNHFLLHPKLHLVYHL